MIARLRRQPAGFDSLECFLRVNRAGFGDHAFDSSDDRIGGVVVAISGHRANLPLPPRHVKASRQIVTKAQDRVCADACRHRMLAYQNPLTHPQDPSQGPG